MPDSPVYAAGTMVAPPADIQSSRVSDVDASRHVRRTLRGNFLWIFAGQTVYAACQWVMLAMLAKLGSPGVVGQFALGLAITAPVVLFTNMNLRTVQATDTTRGTKFGHYLTLRLAGCLVALLMIVSAAELAGYSSRTVLVIAAVGLTKIVEAVSDIYYGLMQQHERMDWMAKSLLLRGPVSLLLFAGAFVATRDLLIATLALGAGWLLILLGYDVRRCQPLGAERPRWEAARLRTLAHTAYPLGIVGMIMSLNPNIPRLFVERHLGQAALGLFAAAAYVLVAGRTVALALGQSAAPRLARYYATGDISRYRSLLGKLLLVGTAGGAAGVALAALAGRHILTLLYTPEYGRYANVFTWLMVAAALSYIASFLWYAVVAARQFRVQVPLFLAVGAISVVSSAVLVPIRGLTGAALALVVTMAAQTIGSGGIIAFVLARRRRVAPAIALVGQTWHVS